MKTNERDVKVDCRGCTACCRGELVGLTQGDDPNDYPKKVWTGLTPGMPYFLGWILPQSRGACVYLVNNVCTIYEKRPRMCRQFSCITWMKNLRATSTRAERRRNPGFNPEVWKAGVEREHGSAGIVPVET